MELSIAILYTYMCRGFGRLVVSHVCICYGVDMLIFQIIAEHADFASCDACSHKAIGAETVMQKCLNQCTYKLFKNYLLRLDTVVFILRLLYNLSLL